MPVKDRWLLPDGVEEILPAEARRLEAMRRRILDLFQAWGYELVMPPLIEYLESLLTGAGKDMDLQTFKLTDQLTGRLMGVRADMTPQAARIDAHYLKRRAPTRLCYLGPVLRTRPGGPRPRGGAAPARRRAFRLRRPRGRRRDPEPHARGARRRRRHESAH